MLIEVNNKIKYQYIKPVFLESNEIRIFPRNDLTQKLLDYNIEINPEPSSRTFFIDPENNCGLKVWFNDLTEIFSLDFKCTVETLRENPYDYIVDFDRTKLPHFHCERSEAIQVKRFSDEIRKNTNNDLLEFLSVLSEKISSEFKYIIRENGPPKTAEQTLTDKNGACRDFAVLFTEACKCQGINARFVSGYMFDEKMQEESHLHAWAEVYVPGGGWRGYDPVNGLAVAGRHIAVAASSAPSKVLPVIGSYRSNAGNSKMEYSINLSLLSE